MNTTTAQEPAPVIDLAEDEIRTEVTENSSSPENRSSNDETWKLNGQNQQNFQNN